MYPLLTGAATRSCHAVDCECPVDCISQSRVHDHLRVDECRANVSVTSRLLRVPRRLRRGATIECNRSAQVVAPCWFESAANHRGLPSRLAFGNVRLLLGRPSRSLTSGRLSSPPCSRNIRHALGCSARGEKESDLVDRRSIHRLNGYSALRTASTDCGRATRCVPVDDQAMASAGQQCSGRCV